MERRRFLMGMGAFAGAALIVPRAATIFDMGRDTGLAAPPTHWDWALLGRLLPTPLMRERGFITEPARERRQYLYKGGEPYGVWISHKNESVRYGKGFQHTFSDGTFYAERNGVIYRADQPHITEVPNGVSWANWSAPPVVDTNPDLDYRRWLQDWIAEGQAVLAR